MERTPLLNGERPASPPPPPPHPHPQRLRTLLLVGLAVLAIDFGTALAYPPSIAIYESIICHQDSTDWSCKSDPVQAELALLTGIKDTMDQIPGILLALPYGLAADRIGRRPILLLCLFGLLLEEFATRAICWWTILPLRAVWATPLAQILGGGPQVATSLAYTIITDVVSPEERTSIFYLMAAVILTSEILASPASALLMWSNSPWIPSLVGLAIQSIGVIAAYGLPETLASPRTSRRKSCPQVTSNARLSTSSNLKLNSTNICILVAFFFASIGKQALQLTIQYASIRFGWSVAEATLLIPLKGIITLVTLLILLPKISSMLSVHMSTYSKELYIVQGSAWMLAIGAAFMAFAPNPVVFATGISILACGWGFYSALRSLAVDSVGPNCVGTVSTAIAMIQSGGTMISGPLLASAFRYGLSGALIWRGLPYMVAAGFFLVTSCLVHCIPRQRQAHILVEERESDTNSDG